ncbi:GHKL domain-containing protein [Paenibacillus psychroresistens]|uniref:histidine kinase n=1 Tax=Paenibacillus psychroresistens TaxID=1778678 RepID=A0A6B8RV29_9BACL|nr:ATP-binding protein [Paenibacillus psychroresistens]QGQ99293.1 GHKL domain-containing protein [Paenibacillus psychroresistens]
MVDLDIRNKFNKRIYYTFCIIAIIFMCSGLLTTILRHEPLPKIWIQFFFAASISFLSLIYPYKETILTKCLLMFSILLYFYALFLLYPDTTTTLALIFFAPILSTILFNRKLFFAIVSFNFLFGTSLFTVISLSQHYKQIYPSISNDLIGNLINFAVCEVLISFVFINMSWRVDRLKQYYRRIQEAERLNTVGQLAASVAHEIRNPLTVVKGFLQLSAKQPLSKDHILLMINELDRTETIIHDYLSLVKPLINNNHLTDVGLEIQSVSNLLYPFALNTKNIIEHHVTDNLWVHVSSIEMKQLLTNILKNAIEAMESNGVICIKAYRSTHQVKIEITDTGAGMSPQELIKLGTPFYSLKQKGTGIGLTVCYDIIEKYKGQIQIQSEKHKGTTVLITLPSVK